jgi:thiamine pyrophosphate-dependent acetolactate synthase large subunit-like protein
MAEKLDRYQCLEYLASKLTSEPVVAWVAFYEWPSISHDRTCNIHISQLGCTVPLGIGLAMALPHRKVIALVSDGDILMELGALPSLGKENPKNLVVFINDNETYQTVGGYPTMTHYKTDLSAMAKGAGVEYSVTVQKFDDFKKEVDEALVTNDCARFIVMKTEAKPYKTIFETIERAQTKYRFIKHIEETEGVKIFPSPVQDRKLLEKRN